jgi:hypothetical protein
VLDHRPQGLVDPVVGPDGYRLHVSELVSGVDVGPRPSATHRIAMSRSVTTPFSWWSSPQVGNADSRSRLPRRIGQSLIRSSEKAMVSDSVWLDAGDLGQTYPRPNQDGAGALPKVFRSLT